MIAPEKIEKLISVYRDGLLKNTMPFWQQHAVDREYGGFLTFLDADGTIVGTDKPMWVAGRITWLFAQLYNNVEPREEWLSRIAAFHPLKGWKRPADCSGGA